MLVDEQGGLSSVEVLDHNFDVTEDLTKWVVLEGCKFQAEDKSAEQLENFEQNAFTATFYEMTNPAQEQAVLDFYFEVFLQWDETVNEASMVRATSEAHQVGDFRPVPTFMLQDGSSSE